MNSKLEIEYPNELLIYKEKIEATIRAFIEIKTKAEDNLLIDQSKYGGFPYFPKDIKYPIDSKGQAMFLLAQINFSETPRLEPFPDSGILQFYISGRSDVYGACFESPAKQDDFKVQYFPKVIEDEDLIISDFSFLPEIESYSLPIDGQSSLTFSLKHAPMPVYDYRFESTILNIDRKLKYKLFQEYQKVYEEHERLFRAEGHKLGGYPYFTQEDPRVFDTYRNEEYMLLFQMDTDDEAGIMWGDCGVANFFISDLDLENRNFSRVLYNWDCC